ncbi:MAG TPA: tyrosine--tRNA ligase [Frankiaceae bacterium]|nr:tyrosine--tRNA ligase [Frankiaceae bacterium]
MTDILSELAWRGLIAQSTDIDALRNELSKPPLSVYCGFDPTAASLHVGHLVPLLILRRFQLAGHRPIALAGGATGMIGDPSGRSSERVLQTMEVIADNVRHISRQLARFLEFTEGDSEAGPTSAQLANNLDWLAPMSAIGFLRDLGKHFPVNAMLAKDSVRSRLDAGGLSYTEFSYMVLQSFDFLELFRREGCVLQVGGSDQWGNITAGIDLIRRVEGRSAHGLTVPLVTSATGEKFGKSTGGGSLWLDPAMTSPYAFYQYWINADDRDVEQYLKMLTFLTRPEVDEVVAESAERPHARIGQRRLARELTTLVHGSEETAAVEKASAALFGNSELAALDERTLASALTEIPRLDVDPEAEPSMVELLTGTGLYSSRGEARRAAAQGGVYLNNVKVTDVDVPVASDAWLHGRFLVLRHGKRRLAAVARGAVDVGRARDTG